MKIKILTFVDLLVIGISACAADSESIIPLVVCALSTLALVPLAYSYKENMEDTDEGEI